MEYVIAIVVVAGLIWFLSRRKSKGKQTNAQRDPTNNRDR